MGKRLGLGLGISIMISLILLTGCSKSEVEPGVMAAADENRSYAYDVQAEDYEPIQPHKGLNQEPVPVKLERIGPNEVNLEMTSQITDIEIAPGINYSAWTFNGEAPGPVVVVKEGDWINFTLRNLDPAIPHSNDFHAVHTNPKIGFANVIQNETGTFRFQASNPGVFMYHCATDPVLAHIANGMHGVIIVMPKDGYPTDELVDREFVIVQNEWYKYNDTENMKNMPPRQVVFSAKNLDYLPGGEFDGYSFDGPNTNGTITSLTPDEPETLLYAKVGERVRFYVNNVGPSEISSFHVIGTLMDDVYIDGNPENHLKGLQTAILPASGGAVVEFTLKEAGTYAFVTHQFDHVAKGAKGVIIVNETGMPETK